MSGAEITPPELFTVDAFLANLSAHVLGKARQAVRLRLVQADVEHPDSVWWVSSLQPQQQAHDPYRVSSDLDPVTRELSWVHCTCAHGMKKGAGSSRCYHVGAVLLALTEPSPEARTHLHRGERA